MKIDHSRAARPQSGQAAKWLHCRGVCVDRAEARRLMAFMARHTLLMRTSWGRRHVYGSQRAETFDTGFLGGRRLHLRLMDLPVYYELFLTGAYDAALRQLPPEPLVVDLGGHVGLFALRTRIMRPLARVVSLEPAPDNVAVYRLNTEGFHEVELRQRAYHPSAERLTLVTEDHGHNHRTREVDFGVSATVGATSLRHLTRLSPNRPIDLLKVDIEGAEAAIPGSPDEEILRSARQLLLETHAPTRIEDFTTGIGPRTIYALGRGDTDASYWIA